LLSETAVKSAKDCFSKSMTDKLTPSQHKVLELIQQSEMAQPISAQGIYLELRNRKQTVGIATVYRALETLKVKGMIKAQMLPTGESLYSLLPADQHHLNCLQCGVSLPIDLCPISHQNLSEVESQDRDLTHHPEHAPAHAQNFKVFYHTLEYFGICGNCQTTTC
jgi:Fur family transcriptional regulator, ferric uptake regulator